MPLSGRVAVRHVEADLSRVILVCRKCSKRLGAGFGPDRNERLAKALRRELAGTGLGKPKGLRKETAVLEVGCLDLCPKNAIVTLRADRPGDWVLVPRGAVPSEVVEHLGLSPAGTGRV